MPQEATVEEQLKLGHQRVLVQKLSNQQLRTLISKGHGTLAQAAAGEIRRRNVQARSEAEKHRFRRAFIGGVKRVGSKESRAKAAAGFRKGAQVTGRTLRGTGRALRQGARTYAQVRRDFEREKNVFLRDLGFRTKRARAKPRLKTKRSR